MPNELDFTLGYLAVEYHVEEHKEQPRYKYPDISAPKRREYCGLPEEHRKSYKRKDDDQVVDLEKDHRHTIIQERVQEHYPDLFVEVPDDDGKGYELQGEYGDKQVRIDQQDQGIDHT